MRIIRIKNRYMFKSKTPDKSHTYALYYDRKAKEYRAVQFTHLMEERKVKQLDKKQLIMMQFKGIKYPSGVRNNYYTTDINGNKLNPKKVEAVFVNKGKHISPDKSKKIKSFAGKRKYK